MGEVEPKGGCGYVMDLGVYDEPYSPVAWDSMRVAVHLLRHGICFSACRDSKGGGADGRAGERESAAWVLRVTLWQGMIRRAIWF